MIAEKTLAYAENGGRQPLLGPIGTSLIGHLLLLGILFFTPTWWNSEPEFIPSVIDVQMVDLSDLGANPVKKSVSKEKTPLVKEKETKSISKSSIKDDSTKKAEVSIAPTKKTTKRALKYKTFKSKKVLKSTIKRVEKSVDRLPPKTLDDTIAKLREKVAKEGRPGSAEENANKKKATGTKSAYGRGSRKEIELIDLYRVEIAHTIQKNWAFAAQIGGDGAGDMASIAFKVMPNGDIADIFFTDRSGNQYLDDSAYRAIKKSSPVRPHPEKLSLPYVEIGLRFTPKGVQ